MPRPDDRCLVPTNEVLGPVTDSIGLLHRAERKVIRCCEGKAGTTLFLGKERKSAGGACACNGWRRRAGTQAGWNPFRTSFLCRETRRAAPSFRRRERRRWSKPRRLGLRSWARSTRCPVRSHGGSSSRQASRRRRSTRPRRSAGGACACNGRRSGSGGDAVEAIADLLSIARLPPGHDPGTDCGVATAARQRWHLAIRHFGLFGGPVAAAND